MATEKILNTRLQLKYDSYANWTNATLGDNKGANFVLKAGEIGICYLPTNSSDGQVTGSQPPQILIKVGDGTSKFSALPWASAKAADVYAWAKQANLPVERASNDGTEGNVISGISWENGKIIYTTASVATSEGMKELQDTINNNKDIWAKDTQYTFTEIEDDNGNIVGIDITSNQGAGESGQNIQFDFITEDQLATALGDYYTKQEVGNLIPNISGSDGIDVTYSGSIEPGGPKATAEIRLILDSSGNVQLSTSDSGLKATVDLSAYQTIANDKDTKYGIEYDSTNKKIKLVANGTNTSIDATDFIADGMLESVVADQENNTLTFTWNTDSGKTVTTINLTDIADIYKGKDGTTVNVSVSNTNEISAEVKAGSLTDSHIAANAGIAKTKLSADVQASLNKADSALQEHQSLADYALKTDIKNGKFTVSGTGALTGSGFMTANQSDNTEVVLDIAENGIEAQHINAEAIEERHIGDHVIGAEKLKAEQGYTGTDAEVWVFYCGDSTTLI